MRQSVSWQKNGRGRGKVSLMESNGRHFLLLNYHSLPVVHADYAYYGSVASQDGDSSCWGRVDDVRNNNVDGSFDGNTSIMLYGKCPVGEDGLANSALEYSTLEEITAVINKYTEERVLFTLDF